MVMLEPPTRTKTSSGREEIFQAAKETGIVRTSVILIALAVAGCSYLPDRSGPPQQGTSSSTSRGIDTLCMNDCLGSNGTKEFCEDRCSY